MSDDKNKQHDEACDKLHLHSSRLLADGDIDGWHDFMEDLSQAIEKQGGLPDRREGESAFDLVLRHLREEHLRGEKQEQ
tara:strand:+ start:1356 stop:1592 length:237 start_codon:yes stop_codon:yes gene_type:complete